MSNDYFTSTDLTANTKAKATDINTRTEAIESGFDKLPDPHVAAPTTKGFSETFAIEDATARDEPAAAGQIQDSGLVYWVDSGAADVYVVTPSPSIGAYAAGQLILMKASANNTGACTVNANGLGPISIKTLAGADPAADAIIANGISILINDGTYFQLMLTTTVASGTLADYLLKIGSDNMTINRGGTPTITLGNTTEEDSEGGRASRLIFNGETSAGTAHTLAKIQASQDGSATDQKGDLIFYTNDGSDLSAPTERLRIDSAGLVTFAGAATVTGAITGDLTGNADTATTAGTVTTAAQPSITSVGTLTSLSVSGNITGKKVYGYNDSDTAICVQGASTTNTSTALLLYLLNTGSPGGQLEVDCNAKITTNYLAGVSTLSSDVNGAIIQTPSDGRLKIVLGSISDALDTIKKINPVKYRWTKAEGINIDMGTGVDYGVVAQELEEVIPELVSGGEASKDGVKGVRYNGLTAFAIKAIQELSHLVRKNKTTNSALKLKVEKLERQNEDLLKRIVALEERRK